MARVYVKCTGDDEFTITRIKDNKRVLPEWLHVNYVLSSGECLDIMREYGIAVMVTL